MGNLLCTQEDDDHFNYSDLDPQHMNINYFQILRVIGNGSFSKVNAIKRRDTKEYYAMKTMEKSKLIREEKVLNIFNERNIWVTLKHPLLVNLHYAFQDEHHLYVVMDLIKGGDLRYHINKDYTVSLERARYYTAQLAGIVHFIHSLGYIHRDLKPDNLLIDRNGNIRLIDFNLTVKTTEQGVRGRAGTKVYMAPEILRKQWYSYPSDYWSIGIIVFEMLTGEVPFHSKSWDKLKIKITKQLLTIPEGYFDKESEALVRGLLKKDPKKRWGYKEMVESEWLRGFNFEDSSKGLLKGPWIPDDDKMYVDGIHDLDDQLMEKVPPQPLTEEQKAYFLDWDYPENFAVTLPNIENSSYSSYHDSDYSLQELDE